MPWSEKETAMLAVAIVSAGGVIIAALINRKKPTGEFPPSKQQSVSIPSPHSTRANPTIAASPSHCKSISDITHSAICAQLKDLSPYHRDRIEKSYIGFRVRWRLILHFMGEAGGKAHLFGRIAGAYDAVECNGSKDAFSSLIHAADGEEIEVEGTISMTGTGLTILDDCVPHRIFTVKRNPVKSD